MNTVIVAQLLTGSNDAIAKCDAEIAALRAQVAELRAWKAAVPMDALRRCHYGKWNYPGWDVDQSEIITWLATA